MKAIRVHTFGEPEVMRLEEVSALIPGSAEVVVRLHAVGVNPVDTYIRSGLYRPERKLPYTPGLDGAGIISAVGSAVKHRQVGQRVYVAWSLSGTYAQEVLCKDHDLAALATGGRVVVIGSRGRVEIDPRTAMGKEAAILGITLYNASEQELASMHAAFAAGLENGTLRPVVSRELPLSDAALAHHAVLEASTFGKIVLLP